MNPVIEQLIESLPPKLQGPYRKLFALAASFDPWVIVVGIAFSLVGILAWRQGRKSQSRRHRLLGLALMLYPYFVPDLWWSLGTGTLLTFFLFWPQSHGDKE